MAALRQLFDDLLFVGELSVPQFARASRGSSRRSAIGRIAGPALRRASSSSTESHCPPGRRNASSFVVLSRTLLGGLIVVAALQRHPIRFDVLAARQEDPDQASPGTVAGDFQTTSNCPSAFTSPM